MQAITVEKIQQAAIAQLKELYEQRDLYLCIRDECSRRENRERRDSYNVAANAVWEQINAVTALLDDIGLSGEAIARAAVEATDYRDHPKMAQLLCDGPSFLEGLS